MKRSRDILAIHVTLLALASCTPVVEEREAPEHAIVDHCWARRAYPSIVIDETRPCPETSVERALTVFWDAGIDTTFETGGCPDNHVFDDGRVCLYVDDEYLKKEDALGHATWWFRHETDDRVDRALMIVLSECRPQVIAHEFGHVLGFGHSSDPTHTMHDTDPQFFFFSDEEWASFRAERERLERERALR